MAGAAMVVIVVVELCCRGDACWFVVGSASGVYLMLYIVHEVTRLFVSSCHLRCDLFMP